MPKKDKYDEEVERMLHKVLGRYHDILFQAANTKKDEDVNGFRERFIKEMQDGVMGFKIAAKDVVDKYIPNLSSVGFSTVSSSPLERSSKNPTVDPSRITKMLQSFGANYSGEEIKLTTYVRMVGSLTTSVDKYRERIDNEIKRRESQGKVTTIMDLQDMIMRDLKGDDITSVKYENGTQMPVDKYAAMLARTTRAETENLSMIQQALREGIDLVECDEISPTCDTCAVYQGRIYSISGKDSRYPALYQTAFKSGYSIIHPNCRHSWFPYHAELYSDAEKREALDRSNRSWRTDTGGRHFQQTEIQRAEFARGQQLMRQWNSELVEYERMRQHYEERKEEPPYKSLGAFRREARKPIEKQSAIMRQWKNHNGDEKEYEIIKSLLGKEAPETLDKFLKIKYNKEEQKTYNVMRTAVSDDRIRRRLGSESYPLSVQTDKQGKHIRGHRTFMANKSYLAVESVEEGQAFADYLIRKYSGTGRLVRDKNGKWTHKEIILADEIVGFVKNPDGEWQPTNKACICYAKDGTHIIPH